MAPLDSAAARKTVTQAWEGTVLSSLSELVAIPAVSQAFDPDWARHGELDRAIDHVRNWALSRGIPEVTAEIVVSEGASPCLLIDVPASTPGAGLTNTVLLYGHLDKQPPVGGWAEGLGPWTPVVREGKLYGRGAADDGYAPYAALTAIEAVRAAGGTHARCVVLLETGEESGSPDLPAYLEQLRSRLGAVSLVVCLDSGANDYERLWLTTSLRGLAQVHVTAKVLEGGQHSGIASGVVPSSFRVLRELLDRLEDAKTGELRLPELHVEISEELLAEIRSGVQAAPGALKHFPFTPGVRTVSDDDLELTLNNTWRPTLSITGAAGLPEPDSAGNVLRPFTTLVLSFRLPPTADSAKALAAIRRALTTEVPYGAQIELGHVEAADGWQAPPLAQWLTSALDEASATAFGGAPWRTLGLGGSIPFMGLLQEMYPSAQFIATGVLGLDSNAHVPDESINLAYAAKLTEALAVVLDAHAAAR
jgi:acetylornithine deacetylase/succinyl-diaminopimelate desuccinylase-like protein